MPKLICPYTKHCELYQGEKVIEQTPLLIYKNVFCHRGLKGWNNCSHYIRLITNNIQ